MYKQIIVGLTMLLTASSLLAQKSGKLVWYDGKKAVTYEVKTDVAPVVKVALEMFSDDMAAVTGRKAIPAKKGILRIIELDKADNKTKNELARKNIPIEKILSSCDGFHISVIDNKVYIVGKNGRGTAYGILEMSRMAGVNPWIWWGDIEFYQKRENPSFKARSLRHGTAGKAIQRTEQVANECKRPVAGK